MRYAVQPGDLRHAQAVLLAAVQTREIPNTSDDELAGLVFDFANNGVLSGVLLSVPFDYSPEVLTETEPDGSGRPVPNREHREPPLAQLFKSGMVRLDVAADPAFAQKREQLRKDLSAIAARRLRPARLAVIKQADEQNILIRHYPADGSPDRLHMLPASLQSVIAHVLLWLLHQLDSNNLRQCHLKGCESFFLTKGRAKRLLRHCGEAHWQEGHRISGAARQAKRRNRLKNAAAKHR